MDRARQHNWFLSVLPPTLVSRTQPQQPQPLVDALDELPEYSVREVLRATGRFAKSAELGRGAFGKVFKGTVGKGASSTPVAVKLFSLPDVQRCWEELEKEVLVLSTVRHANVVRLMGFCRGDRTYKPCVLYEFLPGGSLASWLQGLHPAGRDPLRSTSLRRKGDREREKGRKGDALRRGYKARLKMGTEIVRGLFCLHSLAPPVVHRDIKPQNVMVDAQGHCKLIDFGLAMALSSTKYTGAAGTLMYIAPEYHSEGILSTSTDVFALGIVLLQLFTGLADAREVTRMLQVHLCRPMADCLADLRPHLVGDHVEESDRWPPDVAEEALQAALQCTRPKPERAKLEDVLATLSRLRRQAEPPARINPRLQPLEPPLAPSLSESSPDRELLLPLPSSPTSLSDLPLSLPLSPSGASISLDIDGELRLAVSSRTAREPATADPSLHRGKLSVPDTRWLRDPLIPCSNFLGTSGRIEVMAREVAAVITRALRLRQQLQDSDLDSLLNDVVMSNGIRTLVSDDADYVWSIAGRDKRSDLRAIAGGVMRMAKMMGRPLRDSVLKLNELGGAKDQHWKGVPAEQEDKVFNRLGRLVRATEDLYSEIASFESKQKALTECLYETASAKQEIVNGIVAELRKLEAEGKRSAELTSASLWDQSIHRVVPDLVVVITVLHFRIVEKFGERVLEDGPLVRVSLEDESSYDDPSLRSSPPRARQPSLALPPLCLPESPELKDLTLGETGMALHYANIVAMIDTMVMRSSVFRQRDALYIALPQAVRQRLKRDLSLSSSLEQLSTEEIKARLLERLDWLSTMAENTIKMGVDKRLQGQTNLILLETLYHAKEGRMQALLLELLVNLQHLCSRTTTAQKDPGDGVELEDSELLMLYLQQQENSQPPADWKPVPRFAIVAPTVDLDKPSREFIT